LRANLRLSPQRKALLFTSTGPREGKTTVLVSLSLILAQMGSKVVVIDTDLRRPVIAKIFGINREPGLTDVISGTSKLDEALRGLSDILIGGIDIDEALKTPGLDNITILPSGHIPLNPAGMLGSNQMNDIIKQLKNNYDVILFDAPPALSISDATILAPKLDGAVLVYEMGRTARAALLRSKVQLESVGINVLGIVLNHISPDTYTSYYPYHYRYRYYYNEPPPDEGDSDKEGSR
jgi:Mrp family chromosome partitioning ATPase